MALGPLIKSALKETIEQLPEDFAMKSASVPNLLVKKGVKQEELNFAKLGLPEGKVTKQDLVQAEAGRQDVWSATSRASGEANYEYVTLRGEEDNPTYTERVYNWAPSQEQALDNTAYANVKDLKEQTKFGNTAEPELELLQQYRDAFGEEPPTDYLAGDMADAIASKLQPGYESSHFRDQPGYLMHARVIDQDLGDGKKTRTILEMQSDLHQQGRRYVYETSVDKGMLRRIQGLVDDGILGEDDALVEEAEDLARTVGWNPAEHDLPDWLDAHAKAGIPKAPFESNWLRKVMEFEVARGIEDGADQIAIPLTGSGVETLNRGQGVQKWYETVVKSTAEKLAKQTGGTAELVTKGASAGRVELSAAQIKSAKELLNQLEEYGSDFESGRFDDVVDLADLRLRQWGINPDDFNSTAEALEAVRDSGGVLVGKSEQSDYLVIKPGPKAKEQGFKLYASGGASVAALTVANAMNQGVDDDSITQVLKEQGYSDDEIQKALVKGKKAQLALSEGLSEDVIRQALDEQEPKLEQSNEQQPQMQNWQGQKPAYNYLTGETDTAGQVYDYNRGNYTPTLQERRDRAYQMVTSQEQVSARDLVTSLQVLQPAIVSLTTQAQGALGNTLKARQVEEAEKAARSKIIAMAQERGLNLQWDESTLEYVTPNEQGQLQSVNPTIWDQLLAAKGEATGGIAGAVAGARAGAAIPVPHPLAKLALSAAGSVAGAAIGAAAGAETDYLYNAIKQSEEMSAQVAAHKALTAAEWSVIGDAIGYPVAKLTGAALKGIMNARNFIKSGNTTGAYRALKDTLFVSDSEAQEMTDKLSGLLATPGSNKQEQAIAAAALTKPGAEQIVRAATSQSPRTAQAVLQSIDTRAKDLLATTETTGTGKLLKEDLVNYTTDVKSFFQSVKDEALNAPNAKRVKFNYDALAVDPLLKRLEGNIQDDAVLNKFNNLMLRVRETSDSRTFPDLLELRQIVNGFKYNKRITNTKDFQAIDEVLGNIDNAIDQAAHMAMPNASEWLTKFAQAKAKYAQMISVNNNVLAKALRKPDLSERQVGDLLVKHINSIEGTFDTVLSQLPGNARKKAENAVIDTLANKFTVGQSTGLQVTDFVKLSEQLESIVFNTPEARQMKQAVGKLADVFKNDPNLARVSGSTSFASPTEFLTADPIIAAKMQSARNMFKSVQKYMPTERGRGLALINKVTELLNNPLHAKTMREVMEELPELGPDMQKLQQAYANAQAAGKDVGAAKVKLYGEGKLKDVRGAGTAVDAVPLHRIATAEQIQDVAEAEGLTNGKLLDAALKKRGFVAVMHGSNKVRKL